MNSAAPVLDTPDEGFVLRNRMAGMAVLDILGDSVPLVLGQLKARLQLAPGLFENAPMTLNVQNSAINQQLPELLDGLRHLKLIPVAIASHSLNAADLAKQSHLGLLSLDSGRSEQTETTPVESKPTPAATNLNRLLRKPVRSGQQVTSDGDLIIIGSVSAGAEVIAKGNIHIYGSLRGRAFAGAYGDEKAQIFCHQLDAELIAVAGVFKTSEELQEEKKLGQAARVALANGQLHIGDIGDASF